jgi:hypothetical protein
LAILSQRANMVALRVSKMRPISALLLARRRASRLGSSL